MTITLEEVRDLVKQIVVRDQRFGVEVDLAAWFQDLNYAGLTYAAAMEAMVHYYIHVWPNQSPGERFRATVPELIAISRGLRRERLDQTEFRYVPGDPDEPVDVYLARLREQVAAVADGKPLPVNALEGRSRPMAELISGMAPKTTIPEEIKEGLGRRRHPALGVMCPKCAMPRHKFCVRDDGVLLGYRTHPSRVDSWAIGAAACPQCRAPLDEACRNPDRTVYAHGAHRARVLVAEREI